ncbi:hypothetical protein [Schlesneria paludicola]|uniref:hypothetical protein n=1 Tax=Schlesneria paludicola TaxID=360056 RepID=UPI00029A1237|nr:hypothetical protein [Schlesneria paludicola]
MWRAVLELDSTRRTVSGSTAELAVAIDRAADLRIYTEFRHCEHINTRSSSRELIREVAEFGVTYLMEDKWSAGIMSLRQPIELPHGFGPRSSMSFFLYNQDGTQAIARPYLDGAPVEPSWGPSPVAAPLDMPKYHAFDNWDATSNAPSHNFVYDFDVFRYCVDDSWQEVLSHSSNGAVLSGSLSALVEAFSSGCAIKLGIEGLCLDLVSSDRPTIGHRVYVRGGSAYYYTEQQLFIIGSHPLVRVCPNVPLQYSSRNWDFGWLMVRSDGQVVYRRCDPYTLRFSDHPGRHGVRWFVR